MEETDKGRVPQHIAIIMDGNGRWAKKQGSIRLVGHRFGVGSVRRVTEAAAKAGVRYLTLYVFSTENWNRPASEVEGLMKLLSTTIDGEIGDLMKNNVRLKMVGDGQLPETLKRKMEKGVEMTKDNTGLTLTLALSYSGRWEIADAARRIAEKVERGEMKSSEVNVESFAKELQMSFLPEPELLIRTSGEQRISNFMLWETAYSEFYFTDTLWPDFGEAELQEAIRAYQQRERRFGKTSEQIEDAGKC